MHATARFLLTTILVTSAVQAHDFWLEPSDYDPDPDTTVTGVETPRVTRMVVAPVTMSSTSASGR